MNMIIRQGVFETNSSSSHSLCIKDNNSNEDLEIIDGIIDFDKLDDFCKHFGEDWETCDILEANTINLKLALILKSFLSGYDSYEEYMDCCEEKGLLIMLCEKYNIKGFSNLDSYSYWNDTNEIRNFTFDRLVELIENPDLKLVHTYKDN